VIVIFAFFNQVLFDKLIDFILPGYYFISYYTFFNLLEFFGAFVGLATLISLSMEWFQLQELRKEKSIAEFKALVNQVNPHFLFNGLTVLYTLSLKDNKETSSAIIKLSDILRYVIYQSSANSVSVASEAAILRDYIDLQRYRVHPTTQIDFTEEISTNETAIAPMLFLPLVENAFKHGVHGETQNAFVRMTLREHGGVVNFTITNNRSQINTTPGIGLKNLRERLKLTYPDNHSFVITETDTMYTVNMQVTI
jgi:LytS/YehU family sensor histidine kinase